MSVETNRSKGGSKPDLRTVIRGMNIIRTLGEMEAATGLTDFSAPEVAEAYGCSEAYARRELRRLAEKGRAEVSREVGQAKLYRLSQDGGSR